MPSKNGHALMKALAYYRVSGDDQKKKGYSIPDQSDAVPRWCEENGYEVLEEFEDAGWSGASLVRPDLDRLRDRVAAGGIDAVVVLFRDRLARGVHAQVLKEEFAKHGCRLIALNLQVDDSPEGELQGGIMDQFSAYERAKIAERTRRGRLRKAREGKIVANGGRPNYGFAFNKRRDGYVVNETEAEVTRRIFRMMGEEGHNLYATKKYLEGASIPTPGGSMRWTVTTLRGIVLSDCYMPHGFSELEGMVSAEVAARLDPDANYGVFYYGRRQCFSTATAERGPDGERRYRRRQEYVYRPQEEWIAIPIPDLGVPRETVKAARRSLEGNKKPSSAGDRFWDLSGGVLFCYGCGRRMSPDRRTNSGTSEHVYFYYRCPKRRIMGPGACPNSKTLRAEKAEAAVWEVVRDLLTDPERLKTGLEEMIRTEKAQATADPARDEALWASKVEQIERKRSGFQDMAAEGLITFEELREKLETLSRDHERAKAELEAIADRGRKLKALERDASEILDSYASVVPDELDALGPEDRHHVYKLLQLRAEAQGDGSIKMRGVLDTVARPCVTSTKFHTREA